MILLQRLLKIKTMNKNIFSIISLLFYTSIFSIKIIWYRVSLKLDFNKYKIKAFYLISNIVLFRGKPKRLEIGNNLRTLGKVIFIFSDNKNGLLVLKDRVLLEDGVMLAPRGGSVSIGDDVFIGPNVLIQSFENFSILIGSNVFIAKDTSILGSNHVLSTPELGYQGEIGTDILIMDNVWIGAGVKVLPGVTIGESAVIAAGAVVTRNVDAFSIYAGVPAKKIKEYDLENKTWKTLC